MAGSNKVGIGSVKGGSDSTPSGFIDSSPILCGRVYDSVLNSLNVNADQLICLSIIVGTDFNPGGIKGIGPKKALSLVKQWKYPVQIFREVEEKLDFNWQEVFQIFTLIGFIVLPSL